MRRLVSAWLLLAVGCSASRPSLPSHVPPRVAGAVDRGRVAADTPITFTLALTLRDRAGLDAFLRTDAAANLTPRGFGERFGPRDTDYAHLVAWLRAHELTLEEVPSHANLRVSGRAADVEAALGTELRQYADTRGPFHAPIAITPDASVIATVAGALGLDDATHFYPQHGKPVPDFSSGSADPADLRKLYNAPPPAGALGDGETIAILGAGPPPDPAMDIDGYIQKFTVPVIDRKAQYAQILLGGANRDPGDDNFYTENLLDADMVLAMAPHADIVHVITAANVGLFSDGLPFIINNVPNAHQVSVSFSTCEPQAAGFVLVLNQLFAQAKAEGQQWFFATGDAGTNGCEPGPSNQILYVSYPASSPYVIAVGGTELTLDAMSNVTGEVTWPAGGGGESQYFAKPAFQIAQAGDTRPRTPDDGVRDLPDVSALAGPPGVNIYGQGQLQAVQGTSAATPMWASVFALLDETHGAQGMRDAAEHLYRLGATGGTGFRDITVGSNGNDGLNGANGASGFPAGPGWDNATGWGSPDVQLLISQW